MSKILKANRIRVDSDDKINIEVPVFKPKETKETKSFNPVNHEISFENFDELSLTDDLDDDFTLDDGFQTMNFKENIYENSDEEAEKIIREAKEEAQNIIDDAFRQAEQQKEEIFENARSDGYNEGIASAEAEMADFKAEAKQTLEKAIQEKEDMISATEGEMVEVIANVVDKILCKTINLDKSIIVNLIRQGFSQTTVTGDVFVRVRVDDYRTVTENRDEILNFVDSSVNIEIIKDSSLGEGDCIIETPFGNVDCSLRQQFEGLKASLYYILENG